MRTPYELDVLVPTYRRAGALAVTLTSLMAQDVPLRLVVSDQTPQRSVEADSVVAAVLRVLRHRGVDVEWQHHVPSHGVAENRQFLLDQARAPYVLYLDDDVVLEPGVLRRLLTVMAEQRCGFVTAGLAGLSYADDVRPHEHVAFEPVEGRVAPERVRKGTPGWERWRLHNAANVVHLAQRHGVGVGEHLAYKVAWGSGCVLFDRAKLVDCGGFDFWPTLPAEGAGEDVVAQLRVMERYGGVGVLPSGAHHLELPTTIRDRTVDAYEVVLGAAEDPLLV